METTTLSRVRVSVCMGLFTPTSGDRKRTSRVQWDVHSTIAIYGV